MREVGQLLGRNGEGEKKRKKVHVRILESLSFYTSGLLDFLDHGCIILKFRTTWLLNLGLCIFQKLLHVLGFMCLHVHVATHLLKLSAVIYLSGNQLTLKVQARIFKVQSLYIFFFFYPELCMLKGQVCRFTLSYIIKLNIYTKWEQSECQYQIMFVVMH